MEKTKKDSEKKHSKIIKISMKKKMSKLKKDQERYQNFTEEGKEK